MTINYQNYLTKHIEAVRKCYKLLTGEYLHIHDASKYTSQESPQYDRYFYPRENGVEKNEKIQRDFDYAWLHHIHNNPHHWQYWVLVEDEGGFKPLEIPERYINEMVADWGSFALQKGSGQELVNWYNSHKDKMFLAPETRRKVEEKVEYLAGRIG